MSAFGDVMGRSDQSAGCPADDPDFGPDRRPVGLRARFHRGAGGMALGIFLYLWAISRGDVLLILSVGILQGGILASRRWFDRSAAGSDIPTKVRLSVWQSGWLAVAALQRWPLRLPPPLPVQARMGGCRLR